VGDLAADSYCEVACISEVVEIDLKKQRVRTEFLNKSKTGLRQHWRRFNHLQEIK